MTPKMKVTAKRKIVSTTWGRLFSDKGGYIEEELTPKAHLIHTIKCDPSDNWEQCEYACDIDCLGEREYIQAVCGTRTELGGDPDCEEDITKHDIPKCKKCLAWENRHLTPEKVW